MATKTPHQLIADRLAGIADHSARIVQAQDYDVPQDVRAKLREAREKTDEDDDDDDYFDGEEELRDKMSAEYIKTELAKLKEEAAAIGVTVDPDLLAALIPSIASTTHWNSSSYGC